MTFLRLGVSCVVRDDNGRILLSKREDLDVWNLPSGRLDSGELLETAAQREVVEETGIQCEITRVIGLYHYQGWERMNVLYEARHTGGDLLQATAETRENRFFAPDEIPSNNISQLMLDDAGLSQTELLRVIAFSDEELRQMKLKLRWRWVRNFLRGHIEPRHTRFIIVACAEDCAQNQVKVDGTLPMWGQLGLTNNANLREIIQNTKTNTLHFMFDNQSARNGSETYDAR